MMVADVNEDWMRKIPPEEIMEKQFPLILPYALNVEFIYLRQKFLLSLS